MIEINSKSMRSTKKKQKQYKYHMRLHYACAGFKVQRSFALIFNKLNRNCFLSFSSSAIVKHSHGKKLEAWSWASFYKNQHYVLSWYVIVIWRKLDPVDKIAQICYHTIRYILIWPYISKSRQKTQCTGAFEGRKSYSNITL